MRIIDNALPTKAVVVCIGFVGIIAALLCISDATEVSHLQRSSQSFNVLLGSFIALFVLIFLWLRKTYACKHPVFPINRFGVYPSLALYVLMTSFFLVGIIYAFSLFFTYGSGTAYTYILFKSILLDLCILAAVGISAYPQIANTIRAIRCRRLDYSELFVDVWDNPSDCSISKSSVGDHSASIPLGEPRDNSHERSRDIENVEIDTHNVDDIMKSTFLFGVHAFDEVNDDLNNDNNPSGGQQRANGYPDRDNGRNESEVNDNKEEEQETNCAISVCSSISYQTVGARYDTSCPPVGI